jgi:hypothetical protein
MNPNQFKIKMNVINAKLSSNQLFSVLETKIIAITQKDGFVINVSSH